MNDSHSLDSILARTRRLSRYARQLLDGGGRSLDDEALQRPFGRDEMRAALADTPADAAALQVSLRELRERVMLRTIARDLNGLADLDEVVATATALAEETLHAALAFHSEALAGKYGTPRGADGSPQQLHVVGMGKLGGRELNVSSDIDLIFLYPEEGETDGSRQVTNHEFFTRLGRGLIAALSEITADGFVFRVDTRLRPYGDSGPLVGSFDMLEDYFYTQGREWERYAWVKARVLTGDREKDLMALSAPFVFRRHLDFSALESLRALHSQIRQEVQRRDIADNIKLGRGGIREIEFVIQVFQLIRGGHELALRVRPAMEALALLGVRRLLPPDAVEELRSAYHFLRNLEHRLQYLDDQQTQEIPQAPEDRAVIAEAMGFADHAAFLAVLDRHREAVSRHFDAIFAGARSEDDADRASSDVWLGTLSEEDAAGQLGRLGYQDEAKVLQQLGQLRSGTRYRRMSASGQSRLDRLMPAVIDAAAQSDAPDVTLERMCTVIDSIGRRESYLALLLEYPQALAALARLSAASPWAAEYLSRQPMLLDELIAPQRVEVPDWPRLQAALRAELDANAGNTERQMDLLRHFKHAQTFRLLTLDLAGLLPLETLSDHLSDLAALLLRETLREVWTGLRTRHRDEPSFAIIGYGKLGGKELGYASDLDIIFLYDDEHESAAEVYARLAQRINTWLTSVTPAGVLYESDLRLRPNGVSGLLVSPLQAFRDYQFDKAWVWEHQALTRARAVAGAGDIGAAFEQVRCDVLCMKRDREALKTEVAAMRQKMRDGHPNDSGLFDLKHDPGGIVDVEFAVQYLVLAYACDHPELAGNIGNLALLRLAASLGLIPEALAEGAHAAYRDFRQKQHALRLQGERYARMPALATEAQSAAVVELWQWIFEGDRV
jgi:[glutamine synthetase] adenylyltransferase / [glutamine synthetase]-adenylyl-L-tyrosine phosphorylase